MCGIAAFFKYRTNGAVVDAARWLGIANRVHLKRGPDGEGTWLSKDGTIGLSHRRLAIIDPTPAGAQPMATLDGRLRIVLNGEIYNYKELRRDLERRGCCFVSNSDTEVLLHLYSELGQNSFMQLRGMYAIALWDESKQGLLLARDPLGIKPLYYSDDGHTILVTSQVKALLSAGGADTSPESAGHVGFFLWGYVPEPYTLYKGIRSLRPGTTFWIKRNHSMKNKRIFYNLTDELQRSMNKKVPTNKEQTYDIVGAALDESVRYHMVSDVPVGLFLSSGLDSTSLASIAVRYSPAPLKTFTLGFEQYRGTLNDETVLAECIAERLHCSHKTCWICQKDFLAEMQTVFRSMDQPTIDGVNTFMVSKAAREAGLKVALSGLGGDELLGGYPSFTQVPKIARFSLHSDYLGKAFRVVAAPLIRRFTSPKFAGLLEYGGTLGGAYLLRRGLFMPWELPAILDPEMVREGWRKLNPLINLNKEVEKLNCDHHRVSILETIFYMRNMLLRDTDWASMANSLEVRVPLVDVDLINAIAPLMFGPTKPDKKTMAKTAWNKVPSKILKRPKTGFSIPTNEWIYKEAEMKERGLRGWARVVYREAGKLRPIH